MVLSVRAFIRRSAGRPDHPVRGRLLCAIQRKIRRVLVRRVHEGAPDRHGPGLQVACQFSGTRHFGNWVAVWTAARAVSLESKTPNTLPSRVR